LPRYIAKFEANKDAADYQGTILEMVAEIQDSHGTVRNGLPKFADRIGRFLPPFRVRYIQEQPVVTYVYDEKAGVKLGDSILKIDGEKVEEYSKRFTIYIPSSTPQALYRNLGFSLLRGQKDSKTKLTLRGTDDKIREVEVSRTMSIPDPRWLESAPTKRSTPIFSVLPSGFGYVDINRLQSKDFDQMMETIKNTPAVIFDMRGYPRMDNNRIARHLTDRKDIVAASGSITHQTARDLNKSWSLNRRISFSQKLPEPIGETYKGKVVVLIDENAQSAAEHFCLAVAAATNVTFVGIPTTGANGNVTNTILPGNLNVIFTGAEALFADGRQLQRIGIQPHIKVALTVRGIIEERDEILEAGVKYLQEIVKK